MVTETEEREKILADKRLCFDCTGAKHHAGECKSKLRCQICNRKHHTSICYKQEKVKPLLVATGTLPSRVTYPVVVVEVEGIKCNALLDTGAGISYASAALLDRISNGRKRKEIRKIEMLLGASTREVELTTIEISDINGTFSMPVEVTKVDKGELLSLEKPTLPRADNEISSLIGSRHQRYRHEELFTCARNSWSWRVRQIEDG